MPRRCRSKARVAIGQRCRIDEMLGFGRDPPAVLAAVVGAVGDREDLEGGAIMGAKEALKEMGGRMVAEIRRDVRDPQASAPARANESPDRPCRSRPAARSRPPTYGRSRDGSPAPAEAAKAWNAERPVRWPAAIWRSVTRTSRATSASRLVHSHAMLLRCSSHARASGWSRPPGHDRFIEDPRLGRHGAQGAAARPATPARPNRPAYPEADGGDAARPRRTRRWSRRTSARWKRPAAWSDRMARAAR